MAGRISYTGGIVRNGLVLYLDAAKRDSYPKTGNVWSDLSGNGVIGTLVNGGTGLTYNLANSGSLQFDGLNDYISLNTLSSYSNTNPHTYSAWIYSTAFATYKWVINNGGVSTGTSLITYNNKVGFFYQGGNAIIGSTGTLNLNTWYFITTVYDGVNSVTFYINGVLSSTSSVGSTTWSTINNTPRIGTWFNTNYAYQGNISNVQIYNRALSSTEVLQNYNALKGRYI